jgi:hypothetical protein
MTISEFHAMVELMFPMLKCTGKPDNNTVTFAIDITFEVSVDDKGNVKSVAMPSHHPMPCNSDDLYMAIINELD